MVNHLNMKQALAAAEAHASQQTGFGAPVARHGADEFQREWVTTKQVRRSHAATITQ